MENLVQHYEQRNFELEEKEIESRCRAQMLEKTIPALKVYNTWKVANAICQSANKNNMTDDQRAHNKMIMSSSNYADNIGGDDFPNQNKKLKKSCKKGPYFDNGTSDFSRPSKTYYDSSPNDSESNDYEEFLQDKIKQLECAIKRKEELQKQSLPPEQKQSLMCKLQELKKTNCDLECRLKDLEMKETYYKQTLQQADEMWANMEGGYKEQLRELENKLEEKQNEIYEVEAMVRKMSGEKEMRQQLQERTCSLENEVKDFRFKIAEKECERKLLEKERLRLTEELGNTNEELSYLKVIIEPSLRQQLEEYKKISKEMKREIESLEKDRELDIEDRLAEKLHKHSQTEISITGSDEPFITPPQTPEKKDGVSRIIKCQVHVVNNESIQSLRSTSEEQQVIICEYCRTKKKDFNGCVSCGLPLDDPKDFVIYRGHSQNEAQDEIIGEIIIRRSSQSPEFSETGNDDTFDSVNNNEDDETDDGGNKDKDIGNEQRSNSQNEDDKSDDKDNDQSDSNNNGNEQGSNQDEYETYEKEESKDQEEPQPVHSDSLEVPNGSENSGQNDDPEINNGETEESNKSIEKDLETFYVFIDSTMNNYSQIKSVSDALPIYKPRYHHFTVDHTSDLFDGGATTLEPPFPSYSPYLSSDDQAMKHFKDRNDDMKLSEIVEKNFKNQSKSTKNLIISIDRSPLKEFVSQKSLFPPSSIREDFSHCSNAKNCFETLNQNNEYNPFPIKSETAQIRTGADSRKRRHNRNKMYSDGDLSSYIGSTDSDDDVCIDSLVNNNSLPSTSIDSPGILLNDLVSKSHNSKHSGNDESSCLSELKYKRKKEISSFEDFLLKNEYSTNESLPDERSKEKKLDKCSRIPYEAGPPSTNQSFEDSASPKKNLSCFKDRLSFKDSLLDVLTSDIEKIGTGSVENNLMFDRVNYEVQKPPISKTVSIRSQVSEIYYL